MNSPKIIIAENTDAAERAAAALIEASILAKPASVLGLATGRSMIGVYRALVAAYAESRISFSQVASFNLDEYCGLAPNHPASFAHYMNEHLFDAVDIRRDQAHLPDGNATDAAKSYERAIAEAGGIDLQLLGIGRNGHIGFNEPGSDAATRTRVVELARQTQDANAADFPAGTPVPDHAITMGIATILEARQIVLLATGAAKADAVFAAVNGEVGTHNPASFLRTHSDVTIICDRDAARRLPHPAQAETRHG
ncbi:putative glucosamine-6-phosphate deaminase 2 [Devosia pacifica]|uniref:Glucosamine-6-phosphate deaminase n=1 Tax=Devosia pacifica TaxID=1335967 RepID=A0A918VVK7_9HYPH|nr:glucosamine-6-phosphate deaminase [Devosia pacifica]GHA29843.1 putative glucosamine-6-phosphate deaminase 2 [Devosia pacifica]